MKRTCVAGAGGPPYELRERQWNETFADTSTPWFCFVIENESGELVGFAKGTRHDGGVPGCLGELNKIMKKTPNLRKIVTGVAWYRREQWERLREVSEDAENLDETYDAWLETAERLIRDGIPADVQVEKIDIDVEEVLAWCNARGLPMNATSRSQFVSERVRERHEST